MSQHRNFSTAHSLLQALSARRTQAPRIFNSFSITWGLRIFAAVTQTEGEPFLNCGNLLDTRTLPPCWCYKDQQLTPMGWEVQRMRWVEEAQRQEGERERGKKERGRYAGGERAGKAVPVESGKRRKSFWGLLGTPQMASGGSEVMQP